MKTTIKDICPRCGDLKPMPTQPYGRYKAICTQCYNELHYKDTNFFLISIVAFLSIIVMFLMLSYQMQHDEIRILKAQMSRQIKITELLR